MKGGVVSCFGAILAKHISLILVVVLNNDDDAGV